MSRYIPHNPPKKTLPHPSCQCLSLRRREMFFSQNGSRVAGVAATLTPIAIHCATKVMRSQKFAGLYRHSSESMCQTRNYCKDKHPPSCYWRHIWLEQVQDPTPLNPTLQKPQAKTEVALQFSESCAAEVALQYRFSAVGM